jgi:hypothetical protein
MVEISTVETTSCHLLILHPIPPLKLEWSKTQTLHLAPRRASQTTNPEEMQTLRLLILQSPTNSLAKSDTSATAILCDKFDPGLFEGRADGGGGI